MSSESKRFNPWISTVILGVITILFSLYALQSQSELVEKKKEVEQLTSELAASRAMVEEVRKQADANKAEAEHQRMIAEELMKRYIDKAPTSNSK